MTLENILKSYKPTWEGQRVKDISQRTTYLKILVWPNVIIYPIVLFISGYVIIQSFLNGNLTEWNSATLIILFSCVFAVNLPKMTFDLIIAKKLKSLKEDNELKSEIKDTELVDFISGLTNKELLKKHLIAAILLFLVMITAGYAELSENFVIWEYMRIPAAAVLIYFTIQFLVTLQKLRNKLSNLS
jgi:anaerobic C4-dicarboxylate transporter